VFKHAASFLRWRHNSFAGSDSAFDPHDLWEIHDALSASLSHAHGALKMPKKDRSKNALKHGVFSRELILPGESKKEYALLLSELEAEYSPSGPTEIYLVNHLASLLWRERRLQVYRRANLEQRVRSIEKKNNASYWMGVLKSLAPQLAAAATAKEVAALFASKHLTPGVIPKVPQPPPDQESQWGPAIAEYLNKMETSEPLHGIDAFAFAVDPLEMDRELLLAERLHEEIERTIKRLAQVKGYKQLGLAARVDVNTSKLIEVSPNKAIESARRHNNENSPELAKEMAKPAKRTS
jgi:hypothetical protein